MNIFFKYIFLLVLLSFMISKMCCSINEKSKQIETFGVNERYYQGISPELAGSIDLRQNMNDNSNLTQLLSSQLLKYNDIIDNPELAGSFDFNELQVPHEKKSRDNYNELLRYSEEPSDYMRYEVILPDDYQVKDIKYTDMREEIIEKIQDGVNIHTGDTENVGERSRLGVKINPENDCVGEWSEWNADHCGELNNRCGIKYKKYNITKVEVSDERGDGRPCPYKDNELKFKYCQGENDKDRCGEDENLCECKLDDNKSILLDGENVYDLIGDCDFKINLDCNCPNGYDYNHMSDDEICKLTPGVDCSLNESGCIYNIQSPARCNSSTNTASDCQLIGNTCSPSENAPDNTTCIYIPPVEESCSIPTFMNEELEKRFYEKYDNNKGKCIAKNCDCENGTSVHPSKCDYDGQNKCKIVPCDIGYIMEGNPPSCIRETTRNKCNCPYGIGAQDGRCRGNSNRIICQPDSCSENKFNNTGGVGKDNNIEDNIFWNRDNGFDIFGDYCSLKDNVCNFENIDSLNISRLEINSRIQELITMDVSELIEMAIDENLLDLSVTGTPSKLTLIDRIINNENRNDPSSENEASCLVEGKLDECYNSFTCKDGYSFSPTEEYINDNALRIISCSSDKTPTFNGYCIPVTCPVTDEIKEVYNIPFNQCQSTSINCNLSNVSCVSPEYDDPQSVNSINCIAPQKISIDQASNIPLQVSGCGAVEGTEISDTGATSGSEMIEEDVSEVVLQRLQEQNEELVAQIAELRESLEAEIENNRETR